MPITSYINSPSSTLLPLNDTDVKNTPKIPYKHHFLSKIGSGACSPPVFEDVDLPEAFVSVRNIQPPFSIFKV